LHNLEAAEGDLLIAAGEALGCDCDVRELEEVLAALLDLLCKSCGLGRLLEGVEECRDGCDAGQLVVRD
jgi:hypothetical protein